VLRYEINRFMPGSMVKLEILEKPLAVRGVIIRVSRKNHDHAKTVADFNNAISAINKMALTPGYCKNINKYSGQKTNRKHNQTAPMVC